MDGSWLSELLLADDASLVADSVERLCWLRSEFGTVSEVNELQVNVENSNERDVRGVAMRVGVKDTLANTQSNIFTSLASNHNTFYWLQRNSTAFNKLTLILFTFTQRNSTRNAPTKYCEYHRYR